MRTVAVLLLAASVGASGEADLLELEGSLEALRAHFDAGKDRVRFVAIVSPT